MSDYNDAYNEGWESAMSFVERMIDEITLDTQTSRVGSDATNTCWNASLSVAGWNLALEVLRRRLDRTPNEEQQAR